MFDEVYHLLKPERLTEVVDIGANPVDGEPPYKGLLEFGLCRVTGFEPQSYALSKLNDHKTANETYLPHVIYDGEMHDLHICHGSGMTSLFEPDPAQFALFSQLAPLARVVRKERLATRRLDDIDEIENIDVLKIDVQGSELGVFQSGRKKLANAVAIQTEVSFTKLYKDQPGFGEIDLELRAQGFVPHCFADLKKWPITPYQTGNNNDPLNHILEADMVYVRDFARPETLSDEQLKHLALIAHYFYLSFDLALRLLVVLVNRNAIPRDHVRAYLTHISQINVPRPI